MQQITERIKFWDYLREYREEKQAILAAVERTFESGQLVLGDQGRKFESEIAHLVNTPHAVGVNSCTDALFLSLKALNIGPGDEVITVANTAIPTVSAITATGATPVFVDIDAHTHLMDLNQLTEKYTAKTKVVIPVHLYGQMVDMKAVMQFAQKNGCAVIEDCAQAIGATQDGMPAGSYGDLACFSFYPTKNLGAFGDAGMITTRHENLANRLRRTRFYGISSQYYSIEQGYNSRLDEIQAAILSVRLKKLGTNLNRRREIAKIYDSKLSGLPITLPKTASNNQHTYHLYVCRVSGRDELMRMMRERGVDLAIHYPHAIHLMDGFRHLGCNEGDLPTTEKYAREVVSLPMYPGLTNAEAEAVCEALKDCLKSR